MMLLLAEEDFCSAQNVTYGHRVFDPDTSTWCPVPGGGADALLFGALAVFVGCALYSRLSAVWVLLAGAAFALVSSAINLNHFSNALTVWLDMRPTFLFFEIFLPPLLLDSAVRIDFFLFKKLAAHTLLFAVVNVLLSTLAFIPVMLYGLGLAQAGWSVMDAALFGAMLGSTDAVAVAAILKAGGAPELLSVLLEGESLFNDATSIVLFEVFLKFSLEGDAGGPAAATDLGTLLPQLLKHVGYLMVSGALCGLLMGLLTRLLYKLLHKRHLPPHTEVAASLAGAYTVYLCTEYYVHGSGVIAVVVYGLYGASTYLYGLSSKGLRTGAFFKFLDVLSFCLNSMVFFYVGGSIVNFFISQSSEVFAGGGAVPALLSILKGLPIILAAMFVLRGGLIWLEAPLLSLLGPRMSWQEVVFSTVGGLRGGLALILVQTVVAAHTATPDPRLKVVHAQMALWVSGAVLFTLTVNAPALGPLMEALRLNKTTPLQRKMHRDAYANLSQYTRQTIADLRCDDDEMLKGVDWRAVEAAADISPEAKRALKSTDSLSPSSQAPSKTPTHLGPKKSFATNILQSLTPANNTPRSSTDSGMPATTAAAAAGLPPLPAAARPGRPSQAVIVGAGKSAGAARADGVVGVGGALTVPLLSRIYSGRERYGPDGDSEGEEEQEGAGGAAAAGGGGDIEEGRVVPSQPAAHSSEAFFIASRLHQQDQQLAEHTAAAGLCPFLNLSIDPAAAAAAAADGSPSPSPQLDPAAVNAEEAAAAGGEDGQGPGEGETAAAAAADAAGSEEQAAAAAAAAAKPVLKPLQPLLAVCIADMVKADAVPHSGNRWQQPGLEAHSAADEVSAAAAAVAATQAAMTPQDNPLQGSRASFIAAATGATSAAGWLGLRKQPRRVEFSGVNHFDAPPRSSAPRLGASSVVDLGPKPLQDMDEMSDLSEDDTLTQDQFLEECRISLLAGLKRHFHFKAAEGLLSKTSLRQLDYACDTALSKPDTPLNMWKECSGDISAWGVTPAVASLHMQLRRYQAALLRQRGGCAPWRLFLTAVLSRSSLFLRRYLGKVAVTALEVALELWLALTVSPVAKLMRQSRTHATAMLQEELGDQAAAVWRFIMDRQLEAPDEFASLQTHRVQLAVARRQLAFVERMAQIGALDELAGEELQELLERRLHRLESHGPDWQNPGIMDVLRRLPFLAAAPEGLLLWLRAYGELKSYAPGQCIIPRQRTSPPGVFIVLLGLVRVEVEQPGGRKIDRFVGVGGSVGTVPSIIGRDLPGVGLVAAYGQGNALGRGPTLLHLPMRLLATIRQRARPAIEAASEGQRTLCDLLPAAQTAAAGAAEHSAGSTLSAGGSVVALGPAAAAAAVAGSAGGANSVPAAVFAQLLLDMHRQAGVMLLDRLGNAEVDKLAGHLEGAAQLTLHYASKLPRAKALPKLQRLLQPLLGGNSSSSSSGSSSGSTAAAAVNMADLLAAAFDTQQLNSSSSDTPAAASGDLYSSSSTPTGLTTAAAAAAAAAALDGAVHAAQGNMMLGDEVLRVLHQQAGIAAAKLRDLMRGASVVTLAPGEPLEVSSSVLLLNGSLRLCSSSNSSSTAAAAAGGSSAGKAASSSPSKRGLFRGKSQRTPAAAGPGGAAAGGGGGGVLQLGGGGSYGSLRQYMAPALLAWGPEVFEALEDRYDTTACHATAGPSGALLLVTTHSGSSASSTDGDTAAATPSSPRTGAAAAAAAAGRGQAGSSAPKAADVPRVCRRISSMRLLERSIAPAVDTDVADV